MSCEHCPELVLGTLRADADRTLRQVRELKNLVTILNRAMRSVAMGLIEELYNLISLIPEPPLFDLTFLANLFRCPLTPQALLTDFAGEAVTRANIKAASLPWPQKQAKQVIGVADEFTYETLMSTTMARGILAELLRVGGCIDNVIDSIYRLCHQFIESSKFGWLLRIIIRFIREIEHIVDDAGTFACRLAISGANAAALRVTCPSIYADSRMPYKALVTELSTFSFDGALPNGIDSVLDPLMPPMRQLMFKINRWKQARLLVV